MSSLPALRAALREFERPSLWLGVWLFGWLLCITLSLIQPPNLDTPLPDGDKLGHLLAYALLSAWSVLLFAKAKSRWLAALSLVVLGIALELAQGTLTDYRRMDAMDALANSLGVILGQLLALSGRQTLLQRWDLHLFRG